MVDMGMEHDEHLTTTARGRDEGGSGDLPAQIHACEERESRSHGALEDGHRPQIQEALPVLMKPRVFERRGG
ncbi:hypothetical protein GCM10009638_26460 [Luteococcus sanguinis]